MATLQHTRLHWDFRHTFLPGWPRFLPLPRQQGHHDFMGKPLNPPAPGFLRSGYKWNRCVAASPAPRLAGTAPWL